MHNFTTSVIIAALSLGTPAFVQAQGAPAQSEAQTSPDQACRAVQCPHDANARKHRWPSQFRNQH